MKSINIYTFYAPVEDYVLWDHQWHRGGAGRVPILCPEHISKTMLAIIIKFHGYIDLIKAECSAQES